MNKEKSKGKTKNTHYDYYYNLISDSYDSLHKEEQLNKLKIILANIHINNRDSVLDVGCGTNFCLDYIKSMKKIGIDPSIELLKKSLNKYCVAKAEKIPFPDKSFDYAICITAIHNFDNPEKGLKEIIRVTRKIAVITILKKSPKLRKIENIIIRYAHILKKIEEEKDIIYFIKP